VKRHTKPSPVAYDRIALPIMFPPCDACASPKPTVNGNKVRSFPTHGQQSAAQGSLTTVSLWHPINSTFRLFAHGLVRRWLLIGYFPIHVLPPKRALSAEPNTPVHLSDGRGG
jgi:hypothetical protein